MPEFSLQGLLRKGGMACLGLRLVWRAAGRWALAWLGLLFLQGLIPAAQIYLTRSAVNALGKGAREGWHEPSVLLPVGGIALLWLGGYVVTSLAGWVRTSQAELVQDYVHGLIHRKALALDMAFFDHQESYNLLHRARVDALSQPLVLLDSLGVLVQNGFTLVLMAFLLATYARWLPFLLVVSAMPALWIVGNHVLREHRWRIANTPLVRRANHLDWILTDRGSAPEMRLFDLGEYHHAQFQKCRKALREGRLGLALAELKAEVGGSLVSMVGCILGVGWMLARLWKGMASLGDLILSYQAFQQGQKLLRVLLESAGRVYSCTLFLENLDQFLSLQPSLTVGGKPVPLSGGESQEVRFEGVGFSYPGSQRRALSDFSLTLPPRAITAIVGHNGAGKSTLIKLLCRFYDPQEGSIQLGGVDLKQLEPADLHRQITVLFQEPVRYDATAAENIAMGDIHGAPDSARIQAAAESAGAHAPIQRLNRGYQTMLGKRFGGDELSVGEWQRIALARAFLREAPLLVLDEPTSAMDSWAEIEWLQRFKALAGGRTTLIITHRFTTAMHADMIHVMDSGRILESGTHDELLAANGPYAQSWRAQMQELACV